MNLTILAASLIPLAGTAAGAALVYFLKNSLSSLTTRIMSGFAAGVMTAASVWSLLIPAMDQSADMGRLAFLPAFIGFWLGILLLLGMDMIVPHIHPETMEQEGPKSGLNKTTMLMFAVTLHNVPEGMAVGAVLAGMIQNNASMTMAAAMALAIGVAIQNIPEGAIISMPLETKGFSKTKSFVFGVLSGAVEPVAAWITILFSRWIQSFLPVFLSFAAGAMMYVVVEELIPEMADGEHSNAPALFFAIGFSLMMALDVALG